MGAFREALLQFVEEVSWATWFLGGGVVELVIARRRAGFCNGRKRLFFLLIL